MARSAAIHETLPLGIVIRRQPGVTRWARWAFRAVAVLPGAAPGVLIVACGAGAVGITLAQRPGKRAMTPGDLLRGWPEIPARLD